MKLYRNENDTMRVGAEERNGRYVIIIEKERRVIVATKGRRKAHIETDYTHYEKEFDTKESANKYFLGIKRNNPTLRAI